MEKCWINISYFNDLYFIWFQVRREFINSRFFTRGCCSQIEVSTRAGLNNISNDELVSFAHSWKIHDIDKNIDDIDQPVDRVDGNNDLSLKYDLNLKDDWNLKLPFPSLHP